MKRALAGNGMLPCFCLPAAWLLVGRLWCARRVVYWLLFWWAFCCGCFFARRNRPSPAASGLPPGWDSNKWLHLAAFGLGILLAAGVLLAYNQLAFGCPFASGYLFPSPYNHHNLWSDNPVMAVPGGVNTWLAGSHGRGAGAGTTDHCHQQNKHKKRENRFHFLPQAQAIMSPLYRFLPANGIKRGRKTAAPLRNWSNCAPVR